MSVIRTSTLCLYLPLLAALAVQPANADSSRHKDRPIRLEVVAPTSAGAKGLNFTTNWPLILRLEVHKAVAVVESAEGNNGRREAIVYKDPDGCLDMREFPILPPLIPYEDCDGHDESYFEFTTENIDTFDIDGDRTGNFLLRQRLIDDPFVPGALLNKPYLRNSQGEIVPVPRPQTGGSNDDGYGAGVDDNLPGMVIMADIGVARFFTPDFDLIPGKLRNLAGFINTVSLEFLSKSNRTSIVASMHVLAGQFEPIAIFDLDVADPDVDFLRRLESSPIEAFTFSSPPADDDELFAMLLETYSPVDFELRAVMVDGIAPEIIDDMNHDGRYTAQDLQQMGFRLLSNEVRVRIVEEFDVLVTTTPFGRTCPPQTLLYGDLDGNGLDGAKGCSGSGGARRGRRIPL